MFYIKTLLSMYCKPQLAPADICLVAFLLSKAARQFRNSGKVTWNWNTSHVKL